MHGINMKGAIMKWRRLSLRLVAWHLSKRHMAWRRSVMRQYRSGIGINQCSYRNEMRNHCDGIGNIRKPTAIWLAYQ